MSLAHCFLTHLSRQLLKVSTKILERLESKLHMKNKLLEVNDLLWIVQEQAGVNCFSQAARGRSARKLP